MSRFDRFCGHHPHCSSPARLVDLRSLRSSGSFTNEYTFSLASAADLSAFDTITLVPGSKFTSGVLELFNGTPAHPGTKVASEAITAATPVSPPDATLVELLGAGNYYYKWPWWRKDRLQTY